MDVSKPYAAISPSVDTDVLVTLAGSTRPRTGREISRLTGRSKTGVQAVLDRLVGHGLVDRQAAGEARIYTLNREHILAPVVEQMADARPELIRRLQGAIGSWDVAPVHASVFGSFARGDGDVDSDIDLFIVRPDGVNEEETWRGQLDELADVVRRWTGNHAAIAEVSAMEIPRLLAEQPPVLNALKDDVVELAGKPIQRLLAAG